MCLWLKLVCLWFKFVCLWHRLVCLWHKTVCLWHQLVCLWFPLVFCLSLEQKRVERTGKMTKRTRKKRTKTRTKRKTVSTAWPFSYRWCCLLPACWDIMEIKNKLVYQSILFPRWIIEKSKNVYEHQYLHVYVTVCLWVSEWVCVCVCACMCVCACACVCVLERERESLCASKVLIRAAICCLKAKQKDKETSEYVSWNLWGLWMCLLWVWL